MMQVKIKRIPHQMVAGVLYSDKNLYSIPVVACATDMSSYWLNSCRMVTSEITSNMDSVDFNHYYPYSPDMYSSESPSISFSTINYEYPLYSIDDYGHLIISNERGGQTSCLSDFFDKYKSYHYHYRNNLYYETQNQNHNIYNDGDINYILRERDVVVSHMSTAITNLKKSYFTLFQPFVHDPFSNSISMLYGFWDNFVYSITRVKELLTDLFYVRNIKYSFIVGSTKLIKTLKRFHEIIFSHRDVGNIGGKFCSIGGTGPNYCQTFLLVESFTVNQ